MHRTGLWNGRYQTIEHPSGKYNPQGLRPEISELISRNEARQEQELASMDRDEVRVNYHLLQVWDLLGLYFCCQEPYDDYIEPVPVSYSDKGKGVRLTMRPAGGGRVGFEPYPFDARPVRVQITCKRLLRTSFPDLEAFRRAYFQAETKLLQYELV